MKSILSEKTLVIVLFVMVLVTFSLAQEDCRKMEKAFTGASTTAISRLLPEQAVLKADLPHKAPLVNSGVK